MKSESITIVSKIDPKTFYRFAIFDTLKLRKRWISPAIFAGILLTSSLICFSMYSKAEHAEFLGMVLLVIALGVPGVYFGTFFYSLKTQAHALKLQKSRIAYTIELNQTGILVTSGTSNGSTVSYNWNELFGIYRQLGCIYLYVSVKQAFLLPNGCGDASDEEVWQFITAHLPKEKLHR